MTSQYTLSAVKRENLGKRASKRYRRDNLVPAETVSYKHLTLPTTGDVLV